MINPNDPEEWLSQIIKAPESGPSIVRKLLDQLKTLDNQNEELRNLVIQLKTNIDTQLYEREKSELQRQIRALTRKIAASNRTGQEDEVLLIWTEEGHVLPITEFSAILKNGWQIPAFVSKEMHNLHLLTLPKTEEVLTLSNKGQSTVFGVQEIINVHQSAAQWHRLPNISLGQGEFISFMQPIGGMPLCHGLVLASYGGYVRYLQKWSIERLLISGNFGTGVKGEKDSQAMGQMVYDESASAIFFTRHGKFLRVPVSEIPPNSTRIKMKLNDELVGVVADDTKYGQVLILESRGKAARIPLEEFVKSSFGSSPKSKINIDDLLGVTLVNEEDLVIFLTKEQNHFAVTTVPAKTISISPRLSFSLAGNDSWEIVSFTKIRVG